MSINFTIGKRIKDNSSQVVAVSNEAYNTIVPPPQSLTMEDDVAYSSNSNVISPRAPVYDTVQETAVNVEQSQYETINNDYI